MYCNGIEKQILLKKNLHTAFIDFAKAYDSVPHTRLVTVLKVYRIDEKLVLFLEHMNPDPGEKRQSVDDPKHQDPARNISK